MEKKRIHTDFKALKFAENVSALSVYTDEISFGLGKAIILNANTLKDNLVSVHYGGHGNKVAIPYIGNTVYVTAGGCGDFTASGSTDFLETIIQMYPLSIQDSICPKKLDEYFYSLYQNASYNNKDLGSYETLFVESKSEKAAIEYDKIIWQGEITAPAYAAVTGNLTTMDGFLQTAYINSASTVNVAKTAITASNAIVVLNTIWASTKANAPALIDGCDMFVSPTDFDTIVAACVENFKYNVSLIEMASLKNFRFPLASGLNIVRVNGLHGVASGTALVTKKENIWLSLPEEKDLEFKIWYSDDKRKYCMESSAKLGTGFQQPELVVKIA